jgi:alpha-tubulin suppressor-like RCC1 family protein
VKDHDPIVADGFGTSKDLQKLSGDLQLSLPAVQAMMAAKGRGITSTRKREAEAAAANPTNESQSTATSAASSAWADFMQDEGADDSVAVESSSNKNSNTASKNDNAEGEDKNPPHPSTAALATSSSNEQRSYDLSALQTQPKKMGPPAFKKAKQQPQHQSIVLQTGTLDSEMVGRSKRALSFAYDLVVPTCLPFTKKIKCLVTSCSAVHSLAITTEGQVYGWGRNDNSQLTSSNPKLVVLPTLLDMSTLLSDQHHAVVVGGAVGKAHTVLLTNHGDLYAVGSNKSGQCGSSQSIETISKFKKCQVASGTPVTMAQVASGEDFTLALDEEGCLYSTGSSEFGQLGNGETGQYFVTASKLVFTNCYAFTKRTVFCHVLNEKLYGSAATDYKVVPLPHTVSIGSIACGKHHSVAVEAPCAQGVPRVFTWGCGDYGCLGHGVQKDEYFPRLVASMASTPMIGIANPPVRASAGSQCSLVLTQQGHVYYWGKHRSIGEAVMRPQTVDALANNGHVVTACGAGHQTVVCTTQGAVTVAWGQGPHGELGFGQAKSSSQPQFVKTLEGVPIAQVACGYGHTLYLVKQEDEEDERVVSAISKLPLLDMDEVAPLLERAAVSGSGASGDTKKSAKKRKS